MEGGNRRETLLKDEEEIVTWNKPIDRGEGGNTGESEKTCGERKSIRRYSIRKYLEKNHEKKETGKIFLIEEVLGEIEVVREKGMGFRGREKKGENRRGEENGIVERERGLRRDIEGARKEF